MLTSKYNFEHRKSPHQPMHSARYDSHVLMCRCYQF